MGSASGAMQEGPPDEEGGRRPNPLTSVTKRWGQGKKFGLLGEIQNPKQARGKL